MCEIKNTLDTIKIRLDNTQENLGKSEDTMIETIQAGGVAQVAEHLPSKHGALSSNLNTEREREKR
jgi:hypothetical protein